MVSGFGTGGSSANFDFERLAVISGGDTDFEREIASEFLGQTRELLAQIVEAIERGDASALRQASHTLKGSSRTVGAEGLGAIGAELERSAGDLEPATAAEILSRVQASVSATEQKLDEYFGTDDYRKAA